MGMHLWSAVALMTVMMSSSAQAGKRLNYNRDVRPLLSDRCFACHGPDESHREGDLRLDVEEFAKESAIRANRPAESEFLRRISSDDPDLRMPPADSGKVLSSDEIEILRRWVAEGAVYEPFWAYVPPRKSDPEEIVANIDDDNWSRNWIDRFILARLKGEGIEPSPSADRRTLIRRLSFDLTGLPPTPEEVDTFVHDSRPDAYEQLVDRLLASPHFGERLAVYWLDLVRYADTVGYHGDQTHFISPYRDYVIDAFNRNLPFDQFTREQLAGDLLPQPTTEQLIATGYNRLLQTSHEGGVQTKEYQAIYAADRVRNVSAVWMGGTMGCCQCHSHKYDPYTIKDFYAMAAFFADIDENKHIEAHETHPALSPRGTPLLSELEFLTAEEQALLADLERQLQTALAGREQVSTADDDTAARIKGLQERIGDLHDNAPRTMITRALEPRPMRVLPRGNWMDESGELVVPAIPEFLGQLTPQQERATRLDLANWLTNPQHGIGGLTARVMANRFWYLLLGTGLVKSLEDFGGQGDTPTHPELLDQLAIEFYESGWDVKHLIRLIVTSQTYRQSSLNREDLQQHDPLNRLYARQSILRLPAEMVRDNALSVSGLLVKEIGGGTARPYQPEGYYRHLNFPRRDYVADKDSGQWRRGIYIHWQRQFLHPMLKAFDAPSREECTAERPRSNTPLSALVLLNDPTFLEAARGLAVRLLTEGGDSDAERLDLVCRLVLSRTPDDRERSLLMRILTESRQQYGQDEAGAQRFVSVGYSPVREDLGWTELAAWTQVARVMLNLNESLTRH